MSKKIIFIIVFLVIVTFCIYQGFIKKEEPSFSLEKVSRGTILQEVSETGQVKKGEELNLGFNNAGKIEKIYVQEGDEVKEGTSLAELETDSLYIQLEEAGAAKNIVQTQLNKLLAGAAPEEIKIAETVVSNAEISLNNVKQNLEDTKKICQENLDSAYEDAINVLDAAYLEGEKSLNLVDTIFQTYFLPGDQPWVATKENKEKISNALKEVKPYLDAAKTNPEDENINKALAEMANSLVKTQEALAGVRQTVEDPNYRDIVSSADKTSLDNQRTSINTASINITNSQQTISSTKLTNELSINTAQAKVSTAEGELSAAKNELLKITSPPRQEDIDLYRAQITQADAKIQLLEKQIRETILKSPTDGKITKINKRIGEMIQPMLAESILSLIPTSPFEVEVNIYEEEIVKVKSGDPVDISLVAFPDKIFKGKVLSINPAEKLIERVVYYEVTIGFIEEPPEGVKPGMTADIVIKTASRENVLIVPEDAVVEKDGKTIARVFKDGFAKEQEIEIGLRGSNNMIEVVSGLKEGEEVIIK